MSGQRLEVYVVTKYQSQGEERSRWSRVGVAFPTKDGRGYSIKLDFAVAVTELVMLPPKEKNESGGGQPF